MITETLKLNNQESRVIYASLTKAGFNDKADGNPYLIWKVANTSFTVMYYSSGKLVIQGNGDIKGVLNIIGKSNDELNTNIEEYIAHIGADEVGKGDYFGPLVVVACYVPSNEIGNLRRVGVGDSKKISDGKILELFKVISTSCMYSVKVISPEEYNVEYEKYGNIATFLAKVHSENIKQLIGKLKSSSIDYSYVVIDQFSSNKGRLSSVLKSIKFEQMHKAESLDLPTACASVIARRYFLKFFDEMSERYGFKFPKGASDVVTSARDFVMKYGRERLREVAKISFKTTQQVLVAF